jgi:hypothetical protein
MSPEERSAYIGGIHPTVQDLLISLYGSVDRYVNTKKIEKLESYIIRYEQICGIEVEVLALANDMRFELQTRETALELYDHIRYLTNHKKEIDNFVD